MQELCRECCRMAGLLNVMLFLTTTRTAGVEALIRDGHPWDDPLMLTGIGSAMISFREFHPIRRTTILLATAKTGCERNASGMESTRLSVFRRLNGGCAPLKEVHGSEPDAMESRMVRPLLCGFPQS